MVVVLGVLVVVLVVVGEVAYREGVLGEVPSMAWHWWRVACCLLILSTPLAILLPRLLHPKLRREAWRAFSIAK